MTTRFAPSPTGHLHLGHAFAAAVAQRRAREHGGRFLLRFEDIDHTRVREEYYGQIEEDLRWLGLECDEAPWKQLNRISEYKKALEQLKELNVLYPCFCTRREIQAELAGITNAPHGAEGPLYPGTCRILSEDEIAQYSKTRVPSWRLDSQKAASLSSGISFHDPNQGLTSVDAEFLGDLILARKDIETSYHLAVVVDDAAQGIDLVTRGMDLLGSTHIHRVLQHLLGLPEPAYEHHRLICDETDERLAKRNDPLSLKNLRESGINPNELLMQLEPI